MGVGRGPDVRDGVRGKSFCGPIPGVPSPEVTCPHSPLGAGWSRTSKFLKILDLGVFKVLFWLP